MDEQLLEDFLQNKTDADSLLKNGFNRSNYKEGDFIVTRDHLLRLCNSVLNKKIDTIHLEDISDYIVFSEYFTWDNTTKDGEIVSTTLNDWSNPTLNFPINDTNLLLWKKYLTTGEYTLSK